MEVFLLESVVNLLSVVGILYFFVRIFPPAKDQWLARCPAGGLGHGWSAAAGLQKRDQFIKCLTAFVFVFKIFPLKT